MLLSLRVLVIGFAVVGVALGVAFGVGVAYGRGDPQTIETGLSAQEVRSILGVDAAQSGGGRQGSGAATGGRGGSGTLGAITAIDGQTITIQTARGDVKVTLDSATSIALLMSGSLSDLSVGDSISVAGARQDDGSVLAQSLSKIPEGLIGGGGGGGRRGGASRAGGDTP